jgi:hypothetical protein
MGVIEDYMEMAGGPFISPQRIPDIRPGEKAKITAEPRIDSETFTDRKTGKPKPYIILPVEFRGEEALIRLGKKGLQPLVEAWGKDEKNWVGKELEVDRIETYPGLNQKGIIWKPATPGFITCTCGSRFAEKVLDKTGGKCPSCGKKLR